MNTVKTTAIGVFAVLLFSSGLAGQDYSNVFLPVWADQAWGAGGVTPTGVVWSLDGMTDFDQDGLGEFFLSSSWSGRFGNDAMLYEFTGADSFQIVWYHWFAQLDTSLANYSSIASGDLDNDGLPELIVLTDCYAGQPALHIFEYDPALGAFPAQATADWDLNLPGGVEEAGDIEIANLDSDSRPEILISLFSRNPAAAHLIIAEVEEGSDLSNPVWHVEMDDDSTFSFYSYLVKGTDLDQDGLGELVAVEWNYNRLVIFESTGEDQYSKAADIFTTLESSAFSNDGAAEFDLDGDGFNELFLSSTAGYLWVAVNNGDVSQMSFANNFHLLRDYKTNGGLILTEVKVGNADTPVGQTPDRPDIYLAATDSTGRISLLLDLEYLGGDITDPLNYYDNILFRDSLQGGELFRVSKFGIGNSDNDDAREIVMGSFSLDLNRPHIQVVESVASTAVQPSENHDFPPETFRLRQNYPNPFNPSTTIEFELFRQTEIRLSVYNLLGQKIIDLVDSSLPAGSHQVQWNGRTASGQKAPSGVYFYRLSTASFWDARKMMLLR